MPELRPFNGQLKLPGSDSDSPLRAPRFFNQRVSEKNLWSLSARQKTLCRAQTGFTHSILEICAFKLMICLGKNEV